jgi:hypothetical protein
LSSAINESHPIREMVKPQSWMSRRLPAVIVLFAAAAIVIAPVEVVITEFMADNAATRTEFSQ